MNNNQARQKGLAYLRTTQEKDGSFISYSSPSSTAFVPDTTYKTTFVPALMLSLLTTIDGTEAIRNPLAGWLLGQKTEDWSFNYWASDASERNTQPYPDDLDVIACSLIGLYQHDKTLVDGAALGAIVKLLLATETKIGGPYRTWLVPPDSPAAWLDIDLAVNSNIACFLQLVASPLPSLTKLMEQAITDNTYTSPYYPSEFSIFYYISRAYRGPLTAALRKRILHTKQNGHWDSPLTTALALLSLRQLGDKGRYPEAIDYLLRTQQPNGSWPAEAFSIDPAKHGNTYYHGAAALSTAFVLGALSPPPVPEKAAAVPKTSSTADRLYDRVITSVRQDAERFAPELRTQALHVLERMEHFENKRDIVLLPYMFTSSLASRPASLPEQLYVTLGRANLYGWTAYTIFDDFLDNEGNPAQLSAGTAALRASVTEFIKALPSHAEFQAVVQHTFDVIDSANAWELAYSRFPVAGKRITLTVPPDYGALERLAERSLGHVLTPLGILAHVGHSLTGKSARDLQRALTHYITARQLNDDVHDWQEDIAAGRCTYVVSRILEDAGIAHGSHNLASLLPKMQRTFWHTTLTGICADTSKHTEKARQAAKASGLFPAHNFITVLTSKIDNITQKTLAEQKNTKDFLRSYGNTRASSQTPVGLAPDSTSTSFRT